MLVALTTALAAAPATSTAPLGPEPVFELAEEDLKALRDARAAQFAAVAMPTILLAGGFALAQVPFDPVDGERKITPQLTFAVGIQLVGAIGMYAAPMVLHQRTHRSRRALEAQGLSVKTTPRHWLVPSLTVIGTTVAWSGAAVTEPGDQLGTGLIVGGLAFYTAAVGVGTYQMDLNRQARRQAGWLGVVPTVGRETRGLAVVGRW